MPELIGRTFGVHNGRQFVRLGIAEEMVELQARSVFALLEGLADVVAAVLIYNLLLIKLV